jgi:predicted transcriptional regulator
MSTLLEMAVEIVSAHASATSMSKDELVAEIASVYQALAALEKGEAVQVEAEAAKPALSAKKSIGKNAITCLICGKAMKTLTRHLKTAHDLKPGQYRKQFGIPGKQSLAARSYSESRRQMAIDRGLGEGLAKARAARVAKAAKPAAPKVKAAPKAKAAKVAKKK